MSFESDDLAAGRKKSRVRKETDDIINIEVYTRLAIICKYT